jgi:hypothetical protein
VTVLVFLVIRMLVYVMAAVGRGLARLFAGEAGTDRQPSLAGRLQNPRSPLKVEPAGMCSNRKCRKINVPEARYCSRCGQPLPGARSAAKGASTA